MRGYFRLALALIVAVVGISPLCLINLRAQACPFCEQGGKTLAKEVADAKLVVYGTLDNPVLRVNPDGSNASTTDLTIEEVVKEHEIVKDKKKVVLANFIAL